MTSTKDSENPFAPPANSIESDGALKTKIHAVGLCFLSLLLVFLCAVPPFVGMELNEYVFFAFLFNILGWILLAVLKRYALSLIALVCVALWLTTILFTDWGLSSPEDHSYDICWTAFVPSYLFQLVWVANPLKRFVVSVP